MHRDESDIKLFSSNTFSYKVIVHLHVLSSYMEHRIGRRDGARFTVPDAWAPSQSANSFEEQCVTVQNSDATVL
jgi:hypothetical protein